MSRTARKAADRLAVAILGGCHDPQPGRPLHFHGPRGSVKFFLERMPGGLYVERDECPNHGVRTVQSLCFTDRDVFLQWCDEDPVHFEHLLLHDRLKRTGLDRWDPGDADGP